jgi:hypothetical protein
MSFFRELWAILTFKGFNEISTQQQITIGPENLNEDGQRLLFASAYQNFSSINKIFDYKQKYIELRVYRSSMFLGIKHTGIAIKINENIWITIDFSTLNGRKDKITSTIVNGLKKNVPSKFSFKIVDFNYDKVFKIKDFEFGQIFATLKVNSINREYFECLLERFISLGDAPQFMQEYHALALSDQTDRTDQKDKIAANCRFGTIYIIVLILFEIKENNLIHPDKTNPFNLETCETNDILYNMNIIKKELIKLKDMLIHENVLTNKSIKEKSFENKFDEILDKFKDKNEWLHKYFDEFLKN